MIFAFSGTLFWRFNVLIAMLSEALSKFRLDPDSVL